LQGNLISRGTLEKKGSHHPDVFFFLKINRHSGLDGERDSGWYDEVAFNEIGKTSQIEYGIPGETSTDNRPGSGHEICGNQDCARSIQDGVNSPVNV
jgi:hypothetical protein